MPLPQNNINSRATFRRSTECFSRKKGAETEAMHGVVGSSVAAARPRKRRRGHTHEIARCSALGVGFTWARDWAKDHADGRETRQEAERGNRV